MRSIAQQTELIGRMLRTRLNNPSPESSSGIAKLLAGLESVFARRVRPETGQEIADRAGLFAIGEAVKQRIGVPGLRFLPPVREDIH